MTLCNMAIEAGSRAGLVGVDSKTISYLKDRPFSPKEELWEQAVESWKELISDEGAAFDKVINMEASSIEPQVTWGTSPEMVCGINESIPCPEAEKKESLLPNKPAEAQYEFAVSFMKIGDYETAEFALKEFIDLRNLYEKEFKKVFKKCIKDGYLRKVNVDIAVFSILSTLRWLYSWYSKNQNTNPLVLETELLNNLIGGLKKT